MTVVGEKKQEQAHKKTLAGIFFDTRAIGAP